jgi:hypothetical protein
MVTKLFPETRKILYEEKYIKKQKISEVIKFSFLLLKDGVYINPNKSPLRTSKKLKSILFFS